MCLPAMLARLYKLDVDKEKGSGKDSVHANGVRVLDGRVHESQRLVLGDKSILKCTP